MRPLLLLLPLTLAACMAEGDATQVGIETSEGRVTCLGDTPVERPAAVAQDVAEAICTDPTARSLGQPEGGAS
ncbi:hypothetical protein [Palleronia sp. LCG004]|uniref:hypothetical protein n=1 Tax=Palleronia sp. LCG004 TaxID=3079304 RepID=UPI002942BCFD|nr:hypothetical protein [Palleronia sp. LCG004]WOI56762.1 hypothetical protein RVY76_02910 [Palleronia sp. LCG004]